jgi:hypothetical protein
MRRIKFSVGIIIASLAITWPFAAVWLSAHQVIGSDTERWTCLFCFFGALFGAIYHWSQIISRAPSVLNVILAVVVPVCAVTLVYKARRYSDKMFTYWLLQEVPRRTWQQMASDLDALAKQAAARKESVIPAKDLPQTFTRLGRADHCWGADGIIDFGGGDVGARVAYGSHNRRWGLLVGSKEFLDYSLWLQYKRIPVATNACFFIGSDL